MALIEPAEAVSFYFTRIIRRKIMSASPIRRPYELTAYECQQELAGESDLPLLRALVAARRVLREIADLRVTGTLEGHVQEGVVKSWRYPHVYAVVPFSSSPLTKERR